MTATFVAITSVLQARRLRRAQKRVEDPAILVLLAECCARMGVRRRPQLVESSAVSTPAIAGVFRPRLLLPAGFARAYARDELRFVFLHELAHVKRCDLPMNWIVAALQAVHWFNPLVWYGIARWRLDREIACDALALDVAGEKQNRAYGRTILRLIGDIADESRTPALVGILEDKKSMCFRRPNGPALLPAR